MNLQPLTINEVPISVPLPWPIFDGFGYTLFARGEVVHDRRLLQGLAENGLLRDADALPEPAEAPEWLEIGGLPPSDIFPPHGIKPQVWERVQLRLLTRGTQAYFASRLVGYQKDRSILIAMPEENGRRLQIAEGEALEVRMLTGGNIYVFQSTVQIVHLTPAPYFHMEYPTRVRIQRLRRSPWARVNLTAAVTAADKTERLGRIINLSADGAQVRVPDPVGKDGDTVRLSCAVHMGELKATLELQATVRHVRPVPPDAREAGDLLEYGVAFRNVRPQDAIWLRGLVYQRIAEGYPA